MPYKDKAKALASAQRWRGRNREKCRAYSREYMKTHPKQRSKANTLYRRRQQDKLNALKAEPCSDCKQRFPPECMDFDHVRGRKLASITLLRSKVGWARVLNEITKCDLVCANCHRIRTKERSRSKTTVKAERTRFRTQQYKKIEQEA